MFFSKSNVGRSAILAILVFGLLAVALMILPAAYASPTVTVNPTSGPPGTSVNVLGSGFTPNGQIQSELWNGTSAYSFAADANGNLNTTVVVPQVESGLYGFTITDVASQSTTQTQFTVTTSSASATPTVPEFQSLVVVLILLIATSVAAISVVKKRNSDNT